jgi:hypothetical protein
MMDDVYRQAKRATVGRSVLSIVATICLAASGAFWFTLYWTLLAPPALLSPQTIAAVALGLVYTLALPALAASLAPNSPAAQFLQSKQRETIGFWLMAAATLFLCWHAWTMMSFWWSAQPAVNESGQVVALSISSLIGFVLLPAASWAAVTPETWIASVRQAQEVKRIRRAEQLEDMAYKAYYARTRSILSAGLANATAAQRQEVAGFLLATARAQQRALHAVAETFKDLHGVELEIPTENDDLLARRYSQVAGYLADAADVVGAIDAPPAARSENAPGAARPQPQTYTEPYHADARPHDAASSGTTPQHDAEYTIAYRELHGSWTVRDLARVLSVAEPTARERKIAWERAGLVSGRGLSNGRYQFVT